MKIISLRLQNLGSLSGTWNIDFTDSAFAENSIFAITGPTGAGKSTLLDGLCLALYGATPRLGKITKSSNQIMSRHSGTCFAEVEFSTNKGLFRCHWSQHRSRNKSRGELQQPRHEIVDAEHNSVLATKIRDVSLKVEAVTGMDFDRFTRSTLLAQGGFAAFLQASDDERSPILEQITGTAVYSDISKKVHELHHIEQDMLRDCEQNLTGISILPPEQEQYLKEEMLKANTEVLATTKSLKKITEQLNWLTKTAQLEKELQGYQSQLHDLEKENERSTPQLRSLKEAVEAKELEVQYLALEKTQALALETDLEQKDLKKKQIRLNKRQVQHSARTQTAATTLSQEQRKREEGLKLIREIQKLDSSIDNALLQREKQDIQYYAAKEKCAKNHDHLKQLGHKIIQANASKKLLDDYFLCNGTDEQLPEQIGTMENILTRIEELTAQHQTVQSAKADLLAKLQRYGQQETTLTKDLDRMQEKDMANTHLLLQTQEHINKILQGNSSHTLLQKQFSTEKRQKRIDDLILLLEQVAVYGKELEHLKKQHLKTTAKGKDLTQQLATVQASSAGQQRAITVLEKNILLLVRVQSLEKDRQQLETGLPCPLCGSTTHPYSEVERPALVAEDEEQQLQLQKSQQAATERDIAHLTSQIIHAKEQEKSQIKEMAVKDRQIGSSKKDIQILLTELGFSEDIKVTVTLLRLEKEELALLHNELQQQIKELSELKQKEERLAKERIEATQTRETLKLAVAEAKLRSSAASKELKNSTDRESEIEKAIKRQSNELSQMLHPHASKNQQENSHKAQLQNFHSRIKRWKDKKSEEKELSAQLIKLNTEHDHTAALCATEDKMLIQLEASCKVDKTSLHTLQAQRATLFGDKNTEIEENRLEQRVTAASKEIRLLQQEQELIDAEITEVATLIKRLGKEADKHAKDINIQRQQFTESLDGSSFDTTEAFLKARLTTEAMEALQQLHDRLQKREAELKTLCRERQETLLLEQEKKLCCDTMETLKIQLKEKEEHLGKLQIRAISSREQLKRNSADQEKVKDKIGEIAKQKKICSRWNRLHMLIGSADGKKFRNFAQGLTFELMVHHANTHLKRMSRRYILVRDTNRPLDLNVIDTYQADEIRSTKNLSGGESFLVSLALALGLSRMASRNVRVDSLFLDEGFGTLDENALESALETLAKLREENKLIGVISHVRTLQERVPLQIRVIPSTGGRSRISGPGVSGGIHELL